ncbi:MAG: ubiquinone/menaquinone biosynthesis methyltransferase [Chloroflexi bacterium]|nr:MAG: ubiquinone/menaquinone biosynthesis methyltransferase [Chloroflexota bacterium]
MFGRIAPRYDIMNRLMTFGQDLHWRRLLLQRIALKQNERMLDLGTGTGDIAGEALSDEKVSLCVGADFALEMMQVGRLRPAMRQVRWTGSDALHLPFPGGSFDAVTSGFLMRNVIDIDAALAEQYRVLRVGGRVACLDTTPPLDNWLRPLILMHFRFIMPLLGRLVAGQAEAYAYLPSTTEKFLAPEALQQKFAQAGFRNVRYQRLMLGTVALHWAEK